MLYCNVYCIFDSNKDRAIEESAEHHDKEIKIYKQKVKHLMYDHHSHLAELKASYNNYSFIVFVHSLRSARSPLSLQSKIAVQISTISLCILDKWSQSALVHRTNCYVKKSLVISIYLYL